ncbi:MAG: GNAT family N-acetyltransferase, partial [Planctomycetales bacterium]|nr:GNAT family N-acetyltransferase [Planctomycetales bacterium]
MNEALPVLPAAPGLQRAALELLFSSLSPDEKAAQMSLTLSALRGGRLSLEGLLVALRGEAVAGAVWASELGGAAALLWPPQTVANAPGGTDKTLLSAAEAWMERRGVCFASAYLADDRSPEGERLIAAGYAAISKLLYVVSEAVDFPDAPPAPHLSFSPIEQFDGPRLARLVEATYVDTLDCRQLQAARSTRDVLEGYRDCGVFSPERWLIAVQQAEDVGCVLLTDHPQDDQWELIYMGVAPAFRGRGLGLDIARHAQWLTGQAGRSRLVLGVDADNGPAIRMYSAAGFRTWDERHVLGKA